MIGRLALISLFDLKLRHTVVLRPLSGTTQGGLMAILAECPYCHEKQAVKNKECRTCGQSMDKAKKSQRVRYYIVYRLPDGKQRKEYVGLSIEEARDAEGKRRGQKREGRIFDMLPESKMTFRQLAEWYLKLKSVEKLATFSRVKQILATFNGVFGDRIINTIKPVQLEDYQDQRETKGLAPATIDMEISIVKTMITKAFDNDMVDGRIVKVFRKVKRKLKKAANARKQTLTVNEYLSLCKEAPSHLKAILTTAFNTGMRVGELRLLRWSHVDKEKGYIRLPAELTKERKTKIVPMNHYVLEVMDMLSPCEHHDFVFTYKGEPIKERGGLKRSFKTACKNAKIPHGRGTVNGITFHDIRRTVKTNMVNAGVKKVHRDVIFGHSLQGMDVHYIVPSEDDLAEAMVVYTNWLDNQISSIQAGNSSTAPMVEETSRSSD